MTNNKNNSITTPLSDPCNCFFLRRAARAASRQYSEMMKSTGLKVTQFSVLAILDATGPASITELAAKLGLERTSLSRTLKPLVTDELVSVSDEGERRVKTVSLTGTGRRRLKKALPYWREAQANFSAKLGNDNTETLRQLLTQVAAFN